MTQHLNVYLLATKIHCSSPHVRKLPHFSGFDHKTMVNMDQLEDPNLIRPKGVLFFTPSHFDRLDSPGCRSVAKAHGALFAADRCIAHPGVREADRCRLIDALRMTATC